MPEGEKQSPIAGAGIQTYRIMDKYFAAPIVMSLITIITAIVGKSLYMLLSVSMTLYR